MDIQDVGGSIDQYNGDAMSPEGSTGTKSKLQLPVSCDPAGQGNPPKQLVWIVGTEFLITDYLFLILRSKP